MFACQIVQFAHQQATALSKTRLEKADLLSNLVTEAMQVLGMLGSVFKVDLPKKENGVHYNGDESVDFLVRTNMGPKAATCAKWVIQMI
jgi:DNA repair protein RecN (Recombination protein N)